MKDSTATGPQEITDTSSLPSEVYVAGSDAEDGTFTAKTIKNESDSYTTYYSVSKADYSGTVTTTYYKYTSGAVVGGIGQLNTYYDSTYSQNMTRYAGGGIYVSANGSFVMNSGSVVGNEVKQSASNTVGTDAVTIDPVGAGVYTEGSFTMSGGIISGNSVNGYGGGVYVEHSTFTMTGGVVSANSASKNGGGLFSEASTIILSGTISGNTSQNYGGGVSARSSTIKLSNGDVSANSAIHAGGIYANACGIEISNGFIRENKSNNNGGGIYAAGTELKLLSGEISSNSANQGAGIYSTGNSTITISGGTLSGNKAKNAGGGIYAGGNSIIGLSGGTLSNNTATNNGGGIYATGNNKITLSGGTIGSESENSANSASNGGGIYYDAGELNITGGTVCGNAATSNGGGIYAVNSSKIILSNGSVSGNKANSNGGGIFATGSSTVEISGGTISKNEAPSAGGVYAAGSSKIVISNGSVSENKATNNGGGIFATGSSTVEMSNGTVSENQASQGGGIYIGSNGTIKMSGGIVSQNNVTNNGGGINLNAGTILISGHPVITGNIKGSGESASENNVYLPNNKYITLSGPLTAGAAIGVTTATALISTSSNPIQITTAENETALYESAYQYFIPDAEHVISEADSTNKYVKFSYTNETYYKVTLDLDNITATSGTVTQVKSSGTYIAAITADTGYTLPTTKPDGLSTYQLGLDNKTASITLSNVTADTTITIAGVANKYTVKFDGNGATNGSMNDQSMTYETATTLSENTYTRTGYNFAGWSIYASSKTSEYPDKASVKNLTAKNGETVTLYAVWTQKEVIPTFDSGDTAIQSYPYDGTAKEYALSSEVKDFTIKYKETGSESEATDTKPTTVGTYDVVISRAEDDTYAAFEQTISGGLVITAADYPVSIKADKATMTGSGTVTLTVSSSVTGITITGVSCSDDTISVTANGDGTYSATLPNTAKTYIFTAQVSGDLSNYGEGSATCTVSVTRSGGSSSGGSSSSSTYAVSVDNMKNGTVTVSPTRASKGTTVTITVKPDDGYELSRLTVTDASGDRLTLTDKGNGKYTFTMPASKVTLAASFVEIEEEPAASFIDVSSSAYYYDAVAWAVENGITNGTNAAGTTFSPDVGCTRAQAVTFLWRAAGCPAPKSSVNPFTDVSADAYYYEAVLWAVENGITNGTNADGTTFSPDAVCSRAHIVTFLWRSEGQPAASTANAFADVADSAYYTSAVQWAVENGVTNGTNAAGTTFSPDANCTRAHIVTFLYRCMA